MVDSQLHRIEMDGRGGAEWLLCRSMVQSFSVPASDCPLWHMPCCVLVPDVTTCFARAHVRAASYRMFDSVETFPSCMWHNCSALTTLWDWLSTYTSQHGMQTHRSSHSICRQSQDHRHQLAAFQAPHTHTHTQVEQLQAALHWHPNHTLACFLIHVHIGQVSET